MTAPTRTAAPAALPAPAPQPGETTQPNVGVGNQDGAVNLRGKLRLARRLVTVCRSVMAPLALSLVSRVISLLAGITLMGLAGWAIGTVATPGQVALPLGTVIAAAVGLAVLKGATRYTEQYCGHVVAFSALALLRVYFFRRLAPQAPAAVEGRRSGDLLARVTRDIDRVEVFFAHTLVPATAAVLVPAASLVTLGTLVDPLAAWAVVPFLLLAGVGIPALGGRASAREAGQIRVARGEIAQHFTDTVQGLREVLAFDAAGQRAAHLRHLDDRLGRLVRRHGVRVGVRRGLEVTVALTATVAQLAVGAYLMGGGAVTLAQVTMSVLVTLALFAPVQAVEEFAVDLDQAFAAAQRVFAVTDAAPAVADPSRPQPRPAGPVGLALTDVTFTYPPAPSPAVPPQPASAPALSQVTGAVQAGTWLAVVGASGSGKSTLAKLLARIWDPQGGEITLGGVDVRALSLDDLRGAVALCEQRPALLTTTIRDNVTLARPDASEVDIAKACQLAGLGEMLATAPDGLDTRIGEMGLTLSGGQRQRVALARMLLTEPDVLVLDEATSALDAASEAALLARLREHWRGRTVICITHRVATTATADMVWVLEGGELVEQGTPAQLSAAAGPYAQLLSREL